MSVMDGNGELNLLLGREIATIELFIITDFAPVDGGLHAIIFYSKLETWPFYFCYLRLICLHQLLINIEVASSDTY